MSHEINMLDRGATIFDTWHGHPNYKRVETITNDQARDILDYPMELRQLYFMTQSAVDNVPSPVEAQAFAIIRPTDTEGDVILAHHVGPRFDLQPNVKLWDEICVPLLEQYPDVIVESVGTIRNGATAFINLYLGKTEVIGDYSEIINRIVIYNPVGQGAYKSGGHCVRICCNNTLTAAELQAAATGTLVKVRHTESAAKRIKDNVFLLASVLQAFKDNAEKLQLLTTVVVKPEFLTKFLDKFWPLPEGDAIQTKSLNKRERITELFEAEDSTLSPAVIRTRYKLLQAVTYYVDHESNGDMGALHKIWDTLVGARSGLKADVLNWLTTEPM